METIDSDASSKNADWRITEGIYKGKTVDAMYTTNNLDEMFKQPTNPNQKPKAFYYNRQITNDFESGEGQRQIQDHLGKADFVPLDLRTLTPENRKRIEDYVNSLPKEQSERIILMRPILGADFDFNF